MRNKSNLRIEITPRFDKKLRKLPFEIIIAFKETSDLFLENPHHKILRRHFLKREYAGYQSIDITPDYRAVFKETKRKSQIIIKFYLIGIHRELYKRK